jgi:hypothetical protein
MFGEQTREEKPKNQLGLVEGEAQIEFGKLLDLLHKVDQFVQRCYLVGKNILHQFASLYHPKQSLYQTGFKDLHFKTVIL